MKGVLKTAALMCSAFFLSAAAYAGVVIEGLRVVYPSDARDVSVRLTNAGNTPVLVQAWIDDGDTRIAPKDAKSPFIIMTPIFRMEPSKQQTVRILFNGAGYGSLPSDRESIFWFNALEVPPVTDDIKDKNYLQLAVRTRIKLFYRPAALAAGIGEAPTNSRWRVRQTGQGLSVTVENTSPYYLSLSGLTYQEGDKVLGTLNGGMVGPLSKAEFSLEKPPASAGKNATKSTGKKIIVTLINDWGASIDYEAGEDGKLTLVQPIES